MRNPDFGTYALETGPTETLGGYTYTTDYDANGGTITVTLGSAMYDGRDYVVRCRRNSANAITFNAEGGYALSIDGDGTVPGDASFVSGAGGTGMSADFRIFTMRRKGTNIYVK